jgi:hypothetical protein
MRRSTPQRAFTVVRAGVCGALRFHCVAGMRAWCAVVVLGLDRGFGRAIRWHRGLYDSTWTNRERNQRVRCCHTERRCICTPAAIAKGLAMPVRPAAVRLQMGRRWLSGAAFADAMNCTLRLKLSSPTVHNGLHDTWEQQHSPRHVGQLHRPCFHAGLDVGSVRSPRCTCKQ